MQLVINKLEQLSPLSAAEKAALRATFATVRQLSPGEDLIRQGDRPEFVGAVLQGVMARHRTLSDGARQIVALPLPGDIFDVHGFTLRSVDHSVGAVSRAIVATAPHAAVSQLIRTQPRLGVLLWREAVVEGAILREWVVNCGRRSAYARMAHLFCEIFARLGQVGLTRGDECALQVSQGVLSDCTGLSIVHVNRVLQQLRREGLISLKGGKLVIHDWDALAAVADFDPAYLHMAEPPDIRAEPLFETFTAQA